MRKTAGILILSIIIAMFVFQSVVFASGLTVSSISVGSVTEKTTIGTVPGTIEITMSDSVEESTLSAVTFTKADGSSIKGYCKVSATDNVISVSYGELEETDYVLNISETLMSADGNMNAIAAEYEYAAVSQKLTESFDEMSDAERLSVSEFNADGKWFFGATSVYGGFQPDGLYSIVPVNNMGKVLEVCTRGDGTPTWGDDNRVSLAYQFPQQINDGKITVRYKLWVDGVAHTIGKFCTESGESFGGLSTQNAPNITSIGMGQDGNGFWNIRLELEKDSAGGWIFKIYDDLSSSDEAIYETASGVFGGIDHVAFFQGVRENGDRLCRIDDISIFTDLDNSVGDSSKAVLHPTDENIDIFLNKDVINEAFTVKLIDTDKPNTVIDTEPIYNSEQRKVSLRLRSYLDYGKTYNVVFEGENIKSWQLTTENRPASASGIRRRYKLVSNGREVSYVPEAPCTFTAKTTVNTTDGEARQIMAILFVKDTTGVIISKSYSVTDMSTTDMSLPIEVESEELSSGRLVGDISVMIWEKKASGVWTSILLTN